MTASNPCRRGFAPEPGAPRAAREWVTSLLPDNVPRGTMARIMLVLSELVTNAVLHGAGPIVVAVVRPGAGLTLEVTDAGTGLVRRQRPTEIATGGRGVDLVAQLSVRWGVRAEPGGGTTVWATLDGLGDGADVVRTDHSLR